MLGPLKRSSLIETVPRRRAVQEQPWAEALEEAALGTQSKHFGEGSARSGLVWKTFTVGEYYGPMSETGVLLIEVRNGQLYESDSNIHVRRGDIAMMITSGRKYKVVDPQTGEDVTRNIGRHIGR